MKIAVCVKYVPVVSRITFDYEKKIIIREGVPSEINLFDLLGLVRAVELKQAPGDQVVAISMGPPTAREGLLQCLALGADRAVLLTDRAFAGSDTLATARALALALGQEQPDLIICGRNSTDAETGQVGPEVAELMGIPHVSQVSKLDYAPDTGFPDTRFIEARRVTDLGYQTIQCPLPALVCVTEGVAPELYPDPQQLEEAQDKPLDEVTCAQLSPDSSIFGTAGSPTLVEDIRLVEPDRLGVVFEEGTPEDLALQVAQLVKERLAVLAAGGPETGTAVDSVRYPDRRDKSIWVVAEKSGSGLRRVTLEMLGKARELTSLTQSEVAAVLFGPRDDQLAAELASYGADRVLVLDNTGLGPVCSRRVGEALSAAIEEARPYAVLFASTADGRDLASRIAARMELGLTGDAIDLEIDGEGRLVQLKPALGGNVVAPILSKTLPNLVTMRPGVLTPITPESPARTDMDTIRYLDFQGNDIEVLEEHFQEDIGTIALSQAQVVLGVGMGIGGPENLPKVQALAGSMGATLAASRNVVHAGWLPHQVQVGISGRTIAPKVYIAVGVRGAFNHTVGIRKAGVIIAINSNRRHTIFRAADYGIVGDWETLLPPLVEALKPVLADLG